MHTSEKNHPEELDIQIGTQLETQLDAHSLEGYHLFFSLVGKMLFAFPSYELFNSIYQAGVLSELPISLDDVDFGKGAMLLSSYTSRDGSELDTDEYRDLLSENTHLFAGTQSMEVIPWESAYFNKERMIFQKQTLEVRNWYRKYQLQLVRLNHEPDDHIGLEIEFIAHLLTLVQDQADRGEVEDSRRILDDAKAFIAEHPLQWASKWAEGIKANTTMPLYRGLAFTIPPALCSLYDRL